MVDISFILVLALVSSTVVALPGTNGFTEILARFKQWLTPEPPKLFAESVYEWIPLDEETPTPTSDKDPADIGLSYILQQLNIQPDEFTRGLTSLIVLGLPIYAVKSPTIPESRAEISSKKAVKAAVDCLGVPFYKDIAPVMESYKTSNGKIFVWKFQLRDEPMTQWFEVKVDENTGNNVETIADGDMTFGTATRGIFKGAFDPTSPPQTPKNLVAGAINAFYVIINVQSSEKENYARFDTYLDGHPGVLNLHIFTITEPNRDPALDNTILTHELGHGVSSRLTGGAQTKNCMSKIECGGLSEGYSDMMALVFTAKPEDTRNTKKVMGEYVRGISRGVRRYPYTTDMKVNPLTYQDAVGEKDPYRLGEIWATMLWEVYWNFVEEYGFSANLHDATQEQGNIIFLQLFVGTLMIQPCNPTFESAYDAMLVADDVYYDGIHEHLIRQGFFKRGLDPVSQLDPTMDRLV
ncbi:hypothetical protein BASA60_005965 [Batrachochytrium salamandrivorans]|nr:hypothetical protein BASA60_005965 [Batrachochytrium salamandrivorans]